MKAPGLCSYSLLLTITLTFSSEHLRPHETTTITAKVSRGVYIGLAGMGMRTLATLGTPYA